MPRALPWAFIASCSRFVTENGGEPGFHLGEGHAAAAGVICSLITADAAGAEVAGFGVGDEEAGHRSRRIHRQALGELDTDLLWCEQLPDLTLLCVVRT